MSLDGWQALKCTCGGDRFLEVFNLAWHEGQGTSTKIVGYRCAKCDKDAATDKMIAAIKEQALQKKIDELRAQQANG